MSANIKESLYPRGFEYLLLTSVKTLFPNSQKVLQSSNSIFAFTYLIQLDNLQNSIFNSSLKFEIMAKQLYVASQRVL